MGFDKASLVGRLGKAHEAFEAATACTQTLVWMAHTRPTNQKSNPLEIRLLREKLKSK